MQKYWFTLKVYCLTAVIFFFGFYHSTTFGERFIPLNQLHVKLALLFFLPPPSSYAVMTTVF